ncbi:hypothetical protein Pfo_021001 [Paulownia fortunei]|nr:hypothetical protein Pfo_021001 [Paulownia fortunei]
MWDWHWWCCFVPKTLQKQMLTSWVDRRRRRYLFLILCSPFLLPLFFATCPFICAVEICFLMCRKRRKAAAGGGDGRSGSGEGGDEVGLLQRYLEDQLFLVVGSVYECGDDDENVGEDDGVDVEYFDSARSLLQ